MKSILVLLLSTSAAFAGGMAPPIVQTETVPERRCVFWLRYDPITDECVRERKTRNPERPPQTPEEPEEPEEPSRLGKWEAINQASEGAVGPGGLHKAPERFREAVLDELRSRGAKGDWTSAVDRLKEAWE